MGIGTAAPMKDIVEVGALCVGYLAQPPLFNGAIGEEQAPVAIKQTDKVRQHVRSGLPMPADVPHRSR